MKKFLALGSTLLLLSCSPTPEQEIMDFVANTKKAKNYNVEDIPDLKLYSPYYYKADNLRDPFAGVQSGQSTAQGPELKIGAAPSIIKELPTANSKILLPKNKEVKKGGPDLKRSKEILETIPLDSLSMVGSLQQGSAVWGIIRDKNGMVYKVKSGNYIGENFGYIYSISAKRIAIREWISDAEGNWREREAALTLNTAK